MSTISCFLSGSRSCQGRYVTPTCSLPYCECFIPVCLADIPPCQCESHVELLFGFLLDVCIRVSVTRLLSRNYLEMLQPHSSTDGAMDQNIENSDIEQKCSECCGCGTVSGEVGLFTQRGSNQERPRHMEESHTHEWVQRLAGSKDKMEEAMTGNAG